MLNPASQCVRWYIPDSAAVRISHRQGSVRRDLPQPAGETSAESEVCFGRHGESNDRETQDEVRRAIHHQNGGMPYTIVVFPSQFTQYVCLIRGCWTTSLSGPNSARILISFGRKTILPPGIHHINDNCRWVLLLLVIHLVGFRKWSSVCKCWPRATGLISRRWTSLCRRWCSAALRCSRTTTPPKRPTSGCSGRTR